MIKVGIGYDVHRLKKGEELFIGGINLFHLFGIIVTLIPIGIYKIYNNHYMKKRII